MNKKYWLMAVSALLALSLSACSEKDDNEASGDTEKANAEEVSTDASDTDKEDAADENTTEQTITYLGEDYVLPAKVDNIVAASLESMEDAAILGVKPVGVLAIGEAIPEYLASELKGASLVGDKFAPNNEAILALNPDVILGSSKHGEDVVAAMNKIQTMIPYSHLSENWEENLQLLGKLTGKESKADEIIADYNAKAADAKEKIGDSLKDKTVLVLRIRQGSLAVYSEETYLNSVLYTDLGLQVPEIVTNTKGQGELSLEALADINPDYIFLQFEDSENADNLTAKDDLLANPIFKSITAAKEDHVFVNTVAPLAQGGTAWSKVRFLDAAIKNLVSE
ncbi:ABC transporter substrate-binding protein [Sporosarcina aquimarina]|uniref:ABC transporter substrate-binding protein n=1 Tax=Sporosarcina aquimarina TaxID=114975 RepID=UPI00203D8257|nr:ABC transporter substrate-binding protein [Sporosarcina aquimarina]MCM3758352.1 ABC transporter substrate-binding protein [Sporosarcina aquimarina]